MRYLILLCVLFLSGCAALRQVLPHPGPGAPGGSGTPSPQLTVTATASIFALPGSLNETLVFNSNNPEVIRQEGIVLSTLPPNPPATDSIFLDQAFEGPFTVFSHHIAEDEAPGAHMLYLGLLATNLGSRSVSVDLLEGASYLTQPDAPFVPLPALVQDPQGTVFAGPGDRVATDFVHARSPLTPTRTVLGPDETHLLLNWPLPTNVLIGPPVNGRDTLLHFRSDGPIYLSEVALYAPPSPFGNWGSPSPTDYVNAILHKTLAGPREAPATPYVVDEPPPKGAFKYGRVSGVSVGDRFDATLFGPESSASLPLPGQSVGFAIATAYLNRLGTSQVQSAPMIRRLPGTAYQAHGNYGVTYHLRVPLENRGAATRSFTFSLTQPLHVTGTSPVTTEMYLSPPQPATTFRGPVRLDWVDEQGVPQRQFTHLVLHQGEQAPPFATLQVPTGARYDVSLTLVYPGDSTPPQLLLIGSE